MASRRWLLAAWLLAAPAAAQPAPLLVRRGAGAMSCPDADALWSRAQAHGAAPGQGVVEVELNGDERGLFAVIQLPRRDTERREIHDSGRDCAPLAEAVAVVLGLLLAPTPLTAAAPPTAAIPEPPAPAPPALPGGASRPALGAWLAVGAGGALGLSEQLHPTLALSAALQRGRLGARLDALWATERSLQAGDGSVHLAVLGGAARACYRLTDHAPVDLCGGLFLRQFRAQGAGFAADREARRLSPALLTTIESAGPISARLSWEARLALFAPLRSETLSVENLGTVHQTPPVGALALLALRWSIF